MKKILLSLVLIIVLYGVSYGQSPIQSKAYFIRTMDYACGWHEVFADVNNDGRDDFVFVKGKHVSVGPRNTKFVGRVYVYTWLLKEQIREAEEVDIEEYKHLFGKTAEKWKRNKLEGNRFVREWVSREFDGIEALAVGDANNNKRNEIIVVGSETIAGYERNEEGRYILAYRFGIPNSEGKIFNLFVGNIDGDNKKEIIAIAREILKGYARTVFVCRISLLSWDGKSFIKKWESDTFKSINCVPSVSIADVDGDNKEEILVYLPEDLAIWANGFLWKYDSKAKRYEKESIKEYIGKGADIDGDGCNELVRSIFGEQLRIKKLELVEWKDEKIIVEKVIDMTSARGRLDPIGYNVTGEKEINVGLKRHGREEKYNVLYGVK